MTPKRAVLTGKALAGLVGKIVADGAAEWRTSPHTIVAIMVVPAVIALVGVLTGVIGKDAFKWFTGEDGFAETAQAILYFVAGSLSIVMSRRLSRAGHSVIAGLYLCLACGLFFLVGEELSWGQRIFGWATPESLEAVNKQGETNLHNIYGVGSTFKWIQLVVGAYGVLLPLLATRGAVSARFEYVVSMLVPPVTLLPYFLSMFVWRLYRNLCEPPARYYFAISEFNEVIELILAVGFLLFLVFQLRGSQAWRGTTP